MLKCTAHRTKVLCAVSVLCLQSGYQQKVSTACGYFCGCISYYKKESAGRLIPFCSISRFKQLSRSRKRPFLALIAQNTQQGLPEKKENNTPALARKIQQKLYREKHIGGVDVTGDPAGLQRSTTNEDGTNNYTIITETLGKGVLKPKIKLLKKQPPQVTRCEFVNEVFEGFDGWKLMIDLRCRKLTEYLIYQLTRMVQSARQRLQTLKQA